MTLLIPAPDIQANFRPACDRHSPMNRLRVPSTAIRIEIQPEHRSTFSRLERHPLGCVVTLIAFEESTPSIVEGHFQLRKVRLQHINEPQTIPQSGR